MPLGPFQSSSRSSKVLYSVSIVVCLDWGGQMLNSWSSFLSQQRRLAFAASADPARARVRCSLG